MSRSGAQPKMQADQAWRDLTDAERGPQIFGTHAEWRKFMRNVENSAGIDAQVRTAVESYMSGWVTDQRNGPSGPPVDLTGQSARRVAARSPESPGAKVDGVFDTFGEMVQASLQRHPDGDVADKLAQLSNAFSETVPADGGFLVPEQFRSDIQTVALESAIVRPRATVVPMGSLRTILPTNDSTSNQSSVFGGLVAYWTEEGAQLTKSSAAFARVVLEAKKLTIYGEIPNELMDDAPALDAWLRMAFGSAVSFYEDDAFLVGDGVGQPLGVIGCDAMISVDADTASHIKWVDIVNMYARMLPSSLGRAVWIASPACIPDLLQLSFRDSGDTAGTPALIGTGNGAQSAPTSILGRPILYSEKAPDLGSANAFAFVDLAYYAVGDRRQAALTTSQDFKFDEDKAAIRMIERVDGRPLIQSPITPKNGGDTLSPYVGLSAS